MINVLYMTSLEGSQLNMKTEILADTDKFNVIAAKSWPEFSNKLNNDKIDIIISGMIFSDLKESFGVFFEHWQNKHHEIPFVIYSSCAKELPDEFYKMYNVYIADSYDQNFDVSKALPNLIENIYKTRKIVTSMSLYSSSELRCYRGEEMFKFVFFKEKLRREEAARDRREAEKRRIENQKRAEERYLNRSLPERVYDYIYDRFFSSESKI